MTIDRRIQGVADEAPRLMPVLASVVPFLDLFRDEGELLYDDDDAVYYGLDCDLPLPDEDDSLPGMHWSAGIYEEHVEVLRLRRFGSVSRILGREALTLPEFWAMLRRYGAVRSA